MNRNNSWRFILVVLIVVWAIFEAYPPTNRDLIDTFRTSASHVDATFGDIVAKAQALGKDRPGNDYLNLRAAIGTNDITKYFPQFTNSTTAAHPTTSILNGIQRKALGRIHLGIDLQGGIAFTVQMDTNHLVTTVTETNSAGQPETVTRPVDVAGALSQAVDVLRRRVDQFGVAEPVIQPEGSDRITIALPGVSEVEMDQIRDTIQKVAFLEFRLVHQDSDNQIRQGVPAGYEILTQVQSESAQTKEPPHAYLVKKKPEMVGGIKSAWVDRGNMGQPVVQFTLDPAASDLFGEITRRNVGRQLAIVLDGQLMEAPNIKSPIENGSGEIELGNATDQEAFQLVNVLENPLKAKVTIIDENKVEPTLGRDTIRSGVRASIYGIVAVSLFMLCYYFLSGIVANIALITNVIILIGVIASAEQTLTLPGIAGLVLTVGMAVDANVLIYERIREEKAKGKSLRGAIEAGYDRAFGTIFDSHVTTLISAVVLWMMGTGSIKGFGFSLTWGVAASLFTALVVTRLIFDFLLKHNLIKDLKMLHLIPATMKLDFMKLAKYAFAASWTLIIVGMCYGIFVRGHGVFGVEFTGGEKMVLSVDSNHKPDPDEIRKIAQGVSGREALVAFQHNVGTGADTLQVTVRASDKGNESVSDKVYEALVKQFPEAHFEGPHGTGPLSRTQEGAIIGQEITATAIISSLVAIFGILLYVALRYEFSFAVGAVIAIIHDVFMTLGWYFLAGRELNATTVAAVLTIIGFSINDTIVIFDRIREDLRLGVRGTFREVMNQALNQTLSRTIITSGTVFLATLSLFIFGGGEINDFAFTFLVGIITGTYSSIYIASAIVLWWHKGQRPNIGSSTQVVVEPAAKAT